MFCQKFEMLNHRQKGWGASCGSFAIAILAFDKLILCCSIQELFKLKKPQNIADFVLS